MERVAVFVDAGYLFAQASVLYAGTKQPRTYLTLDQEKVVEVMRQFAERVTARELLRIYWYDGTSSGPSSQHIALAYQNGLKLRLGFVNSVGQQKGVDSLIVTDMITLARNAAMSDAVLLSGDEDLRVGVQQAQEYGVRVHLVGIKPARGSQSIFLMQEADATYEWEEADISPFLSIRSGESSNTALEPPASAPVPTNVADKLGEVARLIANDVQESELSSLAVLIRSTKQIPKPLDGRLLARARAATGHDLDSKEKRRLRDLFLIACETRVAAGAIATVLPDL